MNKPGPAQVGAFGTFYLGPTPFGTFYENFFKQYRNAEKIEREDSLGFFSIHSVAKLQKN